MLVLLGGPLWIAACAERSMTAPTDTSTEARPDPPADEQPKPPVDDRLDPPADDEPPVISQVAVASTETWSATIAWATDEHALGRIDYGTTTAYGASAGGGSTPVTTHEVTISGLEPATTYHYRVTAQDTAGNASTSTDATFTTAPEPDTRPPGISQVAVASTETGSATITWATDEPALGMVDYGTTTAYGASADGDTTPATTHEVTVTGLKPGLTYHYRVTARDTAENASIAGDDTFTTKATPPPEPRGTGIWISPTEIAELPTSGSAWESLLSEADGPCGLVDLTEQDQDTNVCIMAKALVFARTGESRYRTDVVEALTQIVTAPLYDGRALALGRELGAYVISADLIDLKSHDPTLDALFRTAIAALLTTFTQSGPDDLVECHELRPNNWGTHCGASRAAVAVYLGDSAELDRAARVFRGFLGERDSHASFSYGERSWQCEDSRPVPINPAGCTRDGKPLDGVLPDDQRRGGTFTWPAPNENYVWEGLQGALAQAVILYRAGYPVWDWGDRALLRAVDWLHVHNAYPAEGDDTWQPHVVNHYYGTSFPAPIPSRPGKNIGWTDWTHR